MTVNNSDKEKVKKRLRRKTTTDKSETHPLSSSNFTGAWKDSWQQQQPLITDTAEPPRKMNMYDMTKEI